MGEKSEMPRTCNCAGPCGPPEEDGDSSSVSRRGFLTLLGTGVLAATQANAAPPDAAEAKALAAWKRGLDGPSPPRRYRSGEHRDARFPLGGIGTGGFELGVDGQFTTWQLWNTLRDGHVPFFFGIRAGGTAKLLQTVGGPPGLPTIAQIEMTGEYPIATLRYQDPALPIEASLTAFTPLSPLDMALSSLPVACFFFRLHNPTDTPQSVALGAFIQNTVGYDAFGPEQSFNSLGFNTVPARWDNRHPNFGSNHNEPIDGDHFTGLHLVAKAGVPASSGKPIRLFTNVSPDGLNAHPVDHAPGFVVAGLEVLPTDIGDASAVVIWIENASLDLSEPTLQHVGEAVQKGATLVWAGTDSPLLTAYARSAGKGETAPDILFEDFENGYGRWKVEGDAFGNAPATGTLPNQQNVSGFAGKGLVNSYLGGDDSTGRLTSEPFVIERRYIRFLVGGGAHPTTQVRLIVDGKIVRRQSGRNDERLFPALWDVSEFRGKTGHIEIVDAQKGGWGHINADQIEFSDAPVPLAVLSRVGALLPFQFLPAPGDGLVSHAALFAAATSLSDTARVDSGSEVRFLVRSESAGRVALASGSLLSPSEAELIGARQRAFATLARLANIPYTPPSGVPAGAPGFGTTALAVIGGDVRSVSTAFDDWEPVWEAFAKKGDLSAAMTASMPTPAGRTVNGAVAASVTVRPGQSVDIPFLLTWHYPNRFNEHGQAIGNHYATRWPDAGAVLREVVRTLPRLRARTERFRAAFYDSTLPYWLLDCVTSQISTIRHPGVVFRTADGNPYGWEGSNGCCPPTCTHVWGYEQTLAYLFPDLERQMRHIDFACQQNKDGGINNRTEVPAIPGHPTGERPFSDGHASCILKFYREARNQTDPTYLSTQWPRVRAAVDYLIAEDAASSPDGKPDGTLSGDQWNTYDNSIHGVNSFIGTYYLAALRAGEEIAKRVGDRTAANRYKSVFERGRENLIAQCWNGEYFQQHLPGYDKRAGEYGPGCLSDQLLGQWWAHQLGLGYLLPPDKVRTALKSVFRYNWLTDHTGFRHNWRKFAGGKDKGLLICTWPRGGRPANSIPYVDEVWTGVEYQVAAHLAYEGMIEEAYCIVKGARDRYDGLPRAPIPRSPWNEIECGGHYARAMSSWSLLLALSGWDYDGVSRTLRLTPRPQGKRFRSFFSGPEGWGTLEQDHPNGALQRLTLRPVEGRFDIAALHLATGSYRVTSAVLQGKQSSTLAYSTERDHDGYERMHFSGPAVRVSAGHSLIIDCGA
jgi:uncharacterized protein (DUF608 family)